MLYAVCYMLYAICYAMIYMSGLNGMGCGSIFYESIFEYCVCFWGSCSLVCIIVRCV